MQAMKTIVEIEIAAEGCIRRPGWAQMIVRLMSMHLYAKICKVQAICNADVDASGDANSSHFACGLDGMPT